MRRGQQIDRAECLADQTRFAASFDITRQQCLDLAATDQKYARLVVAISVCGLQRRMHDLHAHPVPLPALTLNARGVARPAGHGPARCQRRDHGCGAATMVVVGMADDEPVEPLGTHTSHRGDHHGLAQIETTGIACARVVEQIVARGTQMNRQALAHVEHRQVEIAPLRP